jgi:hypothetical protein
VTKEAHITSRPKHAVGDRVLGLCGKEFKVKVLWADLPRTKPICRDCVDRAINALTEADGVIESVRIDRMLIFKRFEKMTETLQQDLLLDDIADADTIFQLNRTRKAEAKAAEEKAKQTCICVWESPEVFKENPDCPIHGKGMDLTEEIVELPDEVHPQD